LSDVEILGPSDRQRMWAAQEKAALLAEVDAAGGTVRLQVPTLGTFYRSGSRCRVSMQRRPQRRHFGLDEGLSRLRSAL
jgi:hypothetical protein